MNYTHTATRVIYRLRLGTLRTRNIRCTKQESLPKARRLNGYVPIGICRVLLSPALPLPGRIAPRGPERGPGSLSAAAN